MRFSLIAPTFGRSEEVVEFLESLLTQNYPDFEVILGDGTPKDTLRPQLERFKDSPAYSLTIVHEEFLSISDARNRAAEIAKGEYLVFFDSDCIIPSEYLNRIKAHLEKENLDTFGGRDVSHRDFTILQKAISYSMSSIFTTGGIRGQRKHIRPYHPRGFNMGVKKSIFEQVKGYSKFRCGEDIELSIRLIKAGFKVGLIEEAFVYHKRRTTLREFFKQIYRFGAARINIWKKHPEELRIIHLFPFTFSVGTILILLGLLTEVLIFTLGAFLLAFYTILIFLHSLVQNKSLAVGSYSVITSYTMLFGYGWGFFRNWWAYAIENKNGGLKL